MSLRHNLIHFSKWSDIRDHFEAAVYEDRFFNRDTWEPWRKLTCAWDVFKMRWLATVCEFRGHDYVTDGHDYVESGGEGFTCRRCGYSFTAWH